VELGEGESEGGKDGGGLDGDLSGLPLQKSRFTKHWNSKVSD